MLKRSRQANVHTTCGYWRICCCDKLRKNKVKRNKEQNKIYQNYSGYTSGRTEKTAATIREKTERIITQAVKAQVAIKSSDRKTIKRLKVYVQSTRIVHRK